MIIIYCWFVVKIKMLNRKSFIVVFRNNISEIVLGLYFYDIEPFDFLKLEYENSNQYRVNLKNRNRFIEPYHSTSFL